MSGAGNTIGLHRVLRAPPERVYRAFLDQRGDLTGDGLTEDSDFVVFVAGFDALVCP